MSDCGVRIEFPRNRVYSPLGIPSVSEDVLYIYAKNYKYFFYDELFALNNKTCYE